MPTYRYAVCKAAKVKSITMSGDSSVMSRKRSAVKQAEFVLRFEQNYERRARDFAFESGFTLEIRGTEVFIQKDGYTDLLCVAEDPNHFWRSVWCMLCEQFPILARYLH